MRHKQPQQETGNAVRMIGSSDSVEADTPDSPAFDTKRTLDRLIAIGLFLRMVFAIYADNIHHPDELFQYLEQAHRLVFGYGMITWEYRFGIRSWLLPFMVSIPLYACKLLHADTPAIYVPVVKFTFCLLSASLIASCYTIAKNLVSEKAGLLAALFATFWYELIYFSFRPLTDVVATYFLMISIAAAVSKPGRITPYVLGATAAMACALRPQYIPAAMCAFLPAILSRAWPQLVKAGAAFMVVALAAGFIDYLTWGSWFASYYNNFLFNQLHGISKFFGVSGPSMYISALLATSCGILVAAFAFSLLWARRLWLLICTATVVIGVHSLIPHKEYRFIFLAIPILLSLLACCVTLAAEAMPRLRLVWAVVAVLLVVSWAGIENRLPKEVKVYSHVPLYAKDEVIILYQALSRMEHVDVVREVGKPWWATAGYYYLHHNAPIIFMGYAPSLFDPYVTNEVVQNPSPCPSGFVNTLFVGNQHLCTRVGEPPRKPDNLPFSTSIPQKGIDGVYTPNVKPFM